MAKLLVIIGSETDRKYFEDVGKFAEFFGIEYSIEVLSAHRNSEKLRSRLATAESDGTDVIVAAAGMAAHLAGVCAAETILPVIGVPLPGSELNGLDSLLSTVQMPTGVPVATVAIGKAGARNAVVLAARILARQSKPIAKKLYEFKENGARL